MPLAPLGLVAFVFEASGLHHTEEAQFEFGLCPGVSVQLDFQLDFGIRNFWRQSIRHAHHRVSRAAKSGKISVPLRRFAHHRPPRSSIRHQFHSRAGAERRVGGQRGNVAAISERSQLLRGESVAIFLQQRSAAAPPVGSDINCQFTPAANGVFTQNVQRLGLYAEDSWRVTPRLTFNYGLRWDTTFGLFTAEGQSQLENPAVLTLQALQIPLPVGTPHDYRKQFAPRLGVAYSLGQSGNTVVRAGFGLFFNDLAQNGWVTAFQAVNTPLAGPCVNPGDPGCVPGGGDGALIDPHYKTPYSVHTTAGIEHAFNSKWTLSADYVHEQGDHGFARYQYVAGSTLFTPDPECAARCARRRHFSQRQSLELQRLDDPFASEYVAAI